MKKKGMAVGFKRLVMVALYIVFVLNLDASFLETVFTRQYESGILTYESETISGVGASLDHTEEIRRELPALFKTYNITSILDIGCGDFNWMQHVVTSEITYVGIDIVQSVIDGNNQKYSTENISFMLGDACTALLPKVDLIICRDVLPHLSYSYAFKMIDNFVKSGAKYVLFTSYSGSGRENKDLSSEEIGGNYCLNMRKKPFRLFKPLYEINEKCPSPYHLVTPDKTLVLWRVSSLKHSSSAVTYLDDDKWGGRLGDKLLMYIKAYWVAYKYDLTFFYKPFKYSDLLQLHEDQIPWDDDDYDMFDEIEDPYKRLKEPKNHTVDVAHFINRSYKLHIINYYFQPNTWGTYQKEYDAQDVTDWCDLYKDSTFRNILREKIKPLYPIDQIVLPKDRVTVALHVRKGGGYDGKLLSLQLYGDKSHEEYRRCVCVSHARHFTDIGYTIKFPPDQFYVDQIKKLSEMYNDAPMYVHLFTDDLDPQALIDRYDRAVGKRNIIYGCRQKGNHHDKHVFDDLFNMIRFDCLIRSGSNFPQVAQLLGNHAIVLYPKQVEWKSILNVTEIGMAKNHEFAAA